MSKIQPIPIDIISGIYLQNSKYFICESIDIINIESMLICKAIVAYKTTSMYVYSFIIMYAALNLYNFFFLLLFQIFSINYTFITGFIVLLLYAMNLK